MNIYSNMLAAAGRRQIAFDAADEGKSGTPGANEEAAKAAEKLVSDKAAAEKAAADAAAETAVATEAAKKAKTDDEKAELLREVMERKAKQRDLEDRLKSFEGVDVERYKALVAAEQERETRDAEAKGDFERVKTMMAERHKAEKDALEAQLAELNAKLSSKDGTINDLTVGTAFGSSTFISDELVLTPSKARALYGSHFEIEDGQIVGYDKPKGVSARTKLVDASGKALSFDAAMTAIIDADPDRDSLKRSKIKAGSGSNTTPAKVEKPKKADDLFGVSRIAATIGAKK